MNAIFERDMVSRIDQVIFAGRLSDSSRDYGRRLMQRLITPVRVVVAGPPRSGKSALVRLLAGAQGSQETPPLATGVAGGLNATPSGLFDNLVLIEYDFGRAATGGVVSPLADIAPDIILWCTQGFTTEEASFWNRVPDSLKDHSFLVLTKADELIRAGLLYDRLDGLRDIVSREFHSLLPIATLQALAATEAAAPIDPSQHAQSGAKALVEALRRLIRQGRSADLDAAEIFVRRYGDEAMAVRAGRATAPVQLPPLSEPVLTREMPEEIAPAPPEEAVPDSPAPDALCDDADANVSERALRILSENTADFPAEIGADASDEISTLLSLCSDTAESLSEIVSDEEGVSDELSEDVLEASEMMVLLALEDDANAAADAVTLLLQLRRGFETRLAA